MKESDKKVSSCQTQTGFFKKDVMERGEKKDVEKNIGKNKEEKKIPKNVQE